MNDIFAINTIQKFILLVKDHDFLTYTVVEGQLQSQLKFTWISWVAFPYPFARVQAGEVNQCQQNRAILFLCTADKQPTPLLLVQSKWNADNRQPKKWWNIQKQILLKDQFQNHSWSSTLILRGRSAFSKRCGYSPTPDLYHFMLAIHTIMHSNYLHWICTHKWMKINTFEINTRMNHTDIVR